ncbi:PAS domain-containing protein [Chaetomium fimeti]|uniref:PAS domain-containing protein n=1 Tax=Chaetomium fimeti TaxID=1854472 RepID=A0AAE0LXY4_9PEZI|nr:PAS domain-containing protein [Chaetomium fimeti]
MNDSFYIPPLSPEEAQRQLAMQQNGPQRSRDHGQSVMAVNTGNFGGMGPTSPLSTTMEGLPMSAGESLDDIVSQNNREFQRRRSMPHPFPSQLSPHEVDRRLSMMDFSNPGDSIPEFSFAYPNSATLPNSSGQFPQPGLMGMSSQTGFGTLSPNSISMDTFSNMDMGSMGANQNTLNMFDPSDLSPQYPPGTLGAINPDFAMDMGIENTAISAPSVNPMTGFSLGGNGSMMHDAGETFDTTSVPQETSNLLTAPQMGQLQPNPPCPKPREASVPSTFHSPASGTSRAMSHSSAAQPSIPLTPASTVRTNSGPVRPAGVGSRDPKKDVYSKSGFDMMRALFYVAKRKNPTIEIGAVDLSCAFVVTDVTLNDCPIIYVSDNFQNLTGYNRHEIVGKNCRFLQSPDGIVEAGSKREFVANDAVLKLKNAVAEGKEIQQSLINYRKGGRPFLNLLTMIPIPWDTEEIKYYIGFQIDLVECPQAISGDPDCMQVNYQHSDIGQYCWAPPSTSQWEAESGQTLGVDDVSSLIQQYKPKAIASEWHKQSWDKMLLENTDDVIHVLSLKGLFLYLSPACKKTLEYDPSDLVGTSLSSICHPSDIVPVMRELKDAQPNTSVNIAFRIRRKHSGYTWFESHGTLFCEPQAKARKYLILAGRKRPVFSLRRRDVALHSPIGTGGDSEIWSKISTSGMFLYVSSSAKSLLDLLPRDLEGTSMQELIRKECRAEFGRAIEKARKGAITSLRHEVLHKRGQLVTAQTVFYPGGGGVGVPTEGGPSFLIAQTRLLKGAGRVIAAGKGGSSGILTLGGAGSGGEDAMTGVTMGNLPAPVPTGAYPDSSTDEDDDEGDIFAELKTTRCTSWQYELRQMEKVNRLLAEELTQLMANKKKRKRRKGGGTGYGTGGNGTNVMVTNENKTGKVSPRNASRGSSDAGASNKRASTSTASTASPAGASPLRREVSADDGSVVSFGDGSGSGSSGSSGSGGNGMGMVSIKEE